MGLRLAWVTTGSASGLDEDEPLALAGLRHRGVDVDVVAWDDPDVDWACYQRAVLRSTWDYQSRLAEFRSWLERVDAVTDLRNPLPMLSWNLDKHYLRDLDAAQVPITPTTFVDPVGPVCPVDGTDGTQTSADQAGPPQVDPPEVDLVAVDLPEVDLPDVDLVVKPAVGAGGYGVRIHRVADHDQARAHIAALHAGGIGALVQPLLESVKEHGEWPLVFFGGRYSHAANKRVALPAPGAAAELFAAETTTTHQADPEQIDLAQAAVDIVTARFGTPTYARIDLVRDNADQYCVLEVELVEPSLFLPQGGPDALDLLVQALRH